MTVMLQRRLKKETVAYEPHTGRDGQGAPTYGTSVNTTARVHERTLGVIGSAGGAEYVIGPDGTEVRVPLTLYVPGDETNIPDERDRLTVDGSTYIVMQRTPFRGFRASRSSPGHVRLRCADE